MSKKNARPRLSKGILEMKFMQRTKEKVDKEVEDAEEPSFVFCERLIEGRLSFRGMNPEIERLLELEQAERDAANRQEQPADISAKDMAAFYHANKAPTASKTMQKKFQTKNQYSKRKGGDDFEIADYSKKVKAQKSGGNLDSNSKP